MQPGKKTTPSIPDDFPRVGNLGAVTGAQPKLLVSKNELGQYVSTSSEEVFERFDICSDMVEQLVAYCHRKAAEKAEWTREQIVTRVAAALHDKVAKCRWDFHHAEAVWIEQELRKKFN